MLPIVATLPHVSILLYVLRNVVDLYSRGVPSPTLNLLNDRNLRSCGNRFHFECLQYAMTMTEKGVIGNGHRMSSGCRIRYPATSSLHSVPDYCMRRSRKLQQNQLFVIITISFLKIVLHVCCSKWLLAFVLIFFLHMCGCRLYLHGTW